MTAEYLFFDQKHVKLYSPQPQQCFLWPMPNLNNVYLILYRAGVGIVLTDNLVENHFRNHHAFYLSQRILVYKLSQSKAFAHLQNIDRQSQ